jgi:formylglycine-generating enzyme required for sulfatase activity/predicted regulator of Ras-like GTPase activity (Roadblock/LC7/MglB family)
MHLPARRVANITPSVLPRRRDSLGNPDAAWDLLDDLHKIPGVLGSAISTRTGRIVLVDASSEHEQPMIETLAQHLAGKTREVTNQLELGPLRTQTIQGIKYTIATAPIGPGMLTTVARSSVSVAQLRVRISEIQDELGRVELNFVLKDADNGTEPDRKSGKSDTVTTRTRPEPSAPDTKRAAIPMSIDSSRNITDLDTHTPVDVTLDGIQTAEVVDERGVTMCVIPGGKFLMGSEDSDDERPLHEVVVDPFLIDKYPVTNLAYAEFLADRPAWAPHANSMLLGEDYLDHWPNGRFPAALAQHPVVWVSWWQALKGYCAWREGRLPTEAEWEFAGRGADGRIYPWGDIWRTHRCNHYRFGSQWTSSVEQYPSGISPFGVMDLSGNTWEWCADWYSTDFYTTSNRMNPTGPSYGRTRVIRGGSRFNHALYVKLTRRLFYPPHRSDTSIGFRCVKPWPPKSLV